MRAQTSMLIRQPRETVFDCVTSKAFLQRWIAPFHTEEYVAMREGQDHAIRHESHRPEIRQVTEGALGVGTRFKQSNESWGHPLEATIEVIEYQRPTVFAVKLTAEIWTTEIKWIFQPVSEGTMVMFRFRSKARGWWIKLVMLVASLATKNTRAGSPQYMQELKTYIEDQCES